ncbi:DUF484 family protein [Vibrio sp. AK197]
MSQIEADALTAEIVAEYLAENPDFFLHRRELVDRLSLPHQEQGAVPLALVQMNRQRRRIEELEEDITALMSLAANNDKTFHEFMSLQEQVLKCEALLPAFEAVQAMARDLNLTAYIRLLETPHSEYQLSSDVYQRFTTNHLNGKSAYLGRLRKADRHALFGEDSDAPEMGSYVVLPLHKGTTLGLLAFSSEDGGHFQPHMDTLFLRHLALVLSHLMVTLPWQVTDERRSTHSFS